MSNDAQQAEELLKQAGQQRRHETEPSRKNELNEESVSLEGAVCNAYEQIDNGDVPENLTIRDEHLAALFIGLDECDQLKDVGEAAANALDRDVEESLETRATVLKLLVRIGLDKVTPESIEAAKEGRRTFLTSQADEF